jgi:hypothetical protein
VERRISLALAGTGILAALLLLTVGRGRDVSAAEAQSIGEQLDALIRESTASAQARAETLGQLPRLGWLVVTDEATVGDLTADELEFRPHPAEHIELAQIRNRDGQVRVLRRLPAKGAMPLPVSRPGLHLLAAGERVDVVVVVSIPARTRTSELHGGLAVAKTLDTTALLEHLDALGVSASVNNGSGTAWLGHGPRVQGRGTRAIELQSPAGKGTTLLVAAPGMSWLRVMTWFLVLSTLIAAVVFWRRSGGSWLPARLPIPIPRQASWPEQPPGDSADDESAADRTLDPDATTVQAPGLASHATHTRARTGAVPIYPSPPRSARRPTPIPAAADPLGDEYRALWGEFVSLRRTTGESVDDIDRDDFVEQLRRTRAEIMHKDGARDVVFRLVFQNGKAVIRFTTLV